MPEVNPPIPAAARTPLLRRRKRLVIGLLAFVVISVVAAELFCRFVLGLGDPPLFRLDPKIEYLLEPSKTYSRLGNRFSVNSHSMRSPEFPVAKTDPREFRVLVVGDSIVNGGSRVDQSDLATSLLQKSLSESLARPVVVGNVSAGSWGPVNQLEYLKRFSTFGADAIVLVLNSDDIEDVPGVEAIGPRWPRHRPALALLELGERVFPRFVGAITGNAAPISSPISPGTPAANQAATLQALRDIVTLAKDQHACIVVVRYLMAQELAGTPKPGFAIFGSLAESLGVATLSTGPDFLAAGQPLNTLIQSDGVHPTAAGQRVFAGVLLRAASDCAKPASAPQPGSPSK